VESTVFPLARPEVGREHRWRRRGEDHVEVGEHPLAVGDQRLLPVASQRSHPPSQLSRFLGGTGGGAKPREPPAPPDETIVRSTGPVAIPSRKDDRSSSATRSPARSPPGSSPPRRSPAPPRTSCSTSSSWARPCSAGRPGRRDGRRDRRGLRRRRRGPAAHRPTAGSTARSGMLRGGVRRQPRPG
jgi:hypothetical protein